MSGSMHDYGNILFWYVELDRIVRVVDKKKLFGMLRKEKVNA